MPRTVSAAQATPGSRDGWQVAERRRIPHLAGGSSHRQYRERNMRWSSDITRQLTATSIFMEGAFECVEAVKQSVTTGSCFILWNQVGELGIVCLSIPRTLHSIVDSRFYCFAAAGFKGCDRLAALLHGLGKREAGSGLRRTSAFPMRNPAMRRQIGSVTTGHSPDKISGADFRKRNGIVSGCYAIIRLLEHWKQPRPQPQDAIWHPLFCGSVAEDKLHRIPFWIFCYTEK